MYHLKLFVFLCLKIMLSVNCTSISLLKYIIDFVYQFIVQQVAFENTGKPLITTPYKLGFVFNGYELQ